MIAIGCDHGGYELKQEVIKYLKEHNLEYQDFGCDSTEAVDFPMYAKRVAIAVQSGDCRKRNPDLWHRNRNFYYSQQVPGNTCSSLF